MQDSSTETRKILKMKKQKADLQGKVESMQCVETSASFEETSVEEEDLSGDLVELSEQTTLF